MFSLDTLAAKMSMLFSPPLPCDTDNTMNMAVLVTLSVYKLVQVPNVKCRGEREKQSNAAMQVVPLPVRIVSSSKLKHHLAQNSGRLTWSGILVV